MKKILSLVSIVGSFLFPVVVFAQSSTGQLTDVNTFVQNIIGFINKTLVPLIFAVAFLVFLFGVFKVFILGGADEEKRKEGKNLMLYAIIGFLLMVSIWGIVNLLSSGFGFNQKSIDTLIPNAPGTR